MFIISIALMTMVFYYFFSINTLNEEIIEIKQREFGDMQLSLKIPRDSLDIRDVNNEAFKNFIPESYFGSGIYGSGSFEEWRKNVTKEYADAFGISADNFLERKSRLSKLDKSGVISHWLEVNSSKAQMLYLVERVRYKENMEESMGIKFFKKVNGVWLAHANDDLNILNMLPISDINKMREVILLHE